MYIAYDIRKIPVIIDEFHQYGIEEHELYIKTPYLTEYEIKKIKEKLNKNETFITFDGKGDEKIKNELINFINTRR
ncbi:hypothetical protein [Caminibacter pacificus]|uniref:Uncharacterized protein n=1 Tax=Caminibacter pacificus TaxID=1424653 RepID=A0AAJ4RAL7_9BACT|nr:hypothetical protein [Caminibacter pacificus]QDD68194.1 hypothetical protein C6V80_10085 [Caminibacter pacificus]ROR38707.1 hypothetical protein EDC58_1922 [Caminibacter pacificus]